MNDCTTCVLGCRDLCTGHRPHADPDYERWREVYAAIHDLRDKVADEVEESDGDPVVIARLEGVDDAFRVFQIGFSSHPSVRERGLRVVREELAS